MPAIFVVYTRPVACTDLVVIGASSSPGAAENLTGLVGPVLEFLRYII
jgi:hypothetical protein